MPILRVSRTNLPKHLGQLLVLWPEDGRWSTKRRKALKKVLAHLNPSSATDTLLISTDCSKKTLQKLAGWMDYFYHADNLNGKSLKLRPGMKITLAIEGNETHGYLNTIRRTVYRGDPNFVKSEILWSTKGIPLYLERETKCTCRYCGTNPIGDETECRTCGAPLPSC